VLSRPRARYPYRAEEALTNSAQELRLVVETIPALVWRAAPDGNFDYVNNRMLEYLGAPLSEVIGWGCVANRPPIACPA
jgi:PAS domain-containing protein